MSMQGELENLWASLSEESPCGPDLEYDAAFMALERAATTRTERAVGDSVIAAEAPDWERVCDQALVLAQRTRDLRVAMHLTSAWTSMHGLAGWGDGIALLRGLLEQQWAWVHPQLDAEDDDDPTARVNALLGLADPQGALGLLRTAHFVWSARLGRFSLRDLRVADGSIKLAEGDDGPAASRVEIEACCRDCQEDDLAATAQVVQRALEDARAIDALLSDRLGLAAPDMKLLLGDLLELDRFVQPQWHARSGGVASLEDGQPSAAVGIAGGAAVAPSGQISGPEDVRRRIDEICDFYARQEPSSPVPLLLRRAQRLVGCDFTTLLKDLAPGGFDELQRVVGRGDDD